MIELSEMIRQLRQELNTAMADGAAGPVRFELGPVEIEASVAVDREAGAGGKVRFWVVEANAGGKFATSETHRISLTLQPKLVAPDGTQRAVLIAGDEADGER
ncbi:trypco2 family protein [Streptomyces sp. FxanaA7]|uniref:trypco2 family protein n=1 Tax=Streptomyces sp. FxanaA7 TaxID=1265492 RepID=UPI0005EEB8DE|nr:trypco2 family protein [Streptomyces sp. FxanaA7]